jgi:hypothetical protein
MFNYGYMIYMTNNHCLLPLVPGGLNLALPNRNILLSPGIYGHRRTWLHVENHVNYISSGWNIYISN